MRQALKHIAMAWWEVFVSTESHRGHSSGSVLCHEVDSMKGLDSEIHHSYLIDEETISQELTSFRKFT